MPQTLRIALRALGRHKLRTALTTLGMTIGVAAVITIVALGSGAQETVADDVRSAGPNLIHVDAGNFTRGGEESKIASGLGSASTLSADDARAIAALPGVKRVSTVVKLRGWVSRDDVREYLQVFGTDASFAQLYGWRLARGKYFAAGAADSGTPVAVLGSGARERLFGDADAVGRDVRVRDQAFRVVGVVSGGDEDQMDAVYVPTSALQRLLGIQHVHSIYVAAEQAGDTTALAEAITPLLRSRHHLDTSAAIERLRRGGLLGNQMPHGSSVGSHDVPDDFTVKTQAAEALTKGLYTSVAAFVLANMPKVDQVNLEEMSGTLQRAGSTMTILLTAIAAISLIVGGIGIMNVMLVSVSERTHEIGLRRAVGARRHDVMQQFLVEALTLSCGGGLVGIACGFAAAAIVTRVLEWPASVSFSAVALAFGIAAAVGIFFGFYPARRASRLDPIDALRHE
jgi:ABC-type antimicrobial peptide transport system permease subunit